ncbi:aquaporin-11-like [Osmerus eperlanus]|uniref:aquaporin-11-like n=1 Tax=Osmerus eperlanus TaxID=29151 RepID=UPI002E157B22
MADLGISLVLLAAIVFLCEASRRTTAQLFGNKYGLYITEIISTFQLCACTQELKLLGEAGQIEPYIGLTITYVITVVHITTFQGALCNPYGAFERVYRREVTYASAVCLIACQIIAAIAAQFLAPYIWTLGLSDLHVSHGRFGFKCFSPLGGTLIEAAAVELACTFSVQAAVIHIHKVEEKLQVHAIAAIITFVVYAGGSISGAVFNPVLALSVQFPCSGHTFLEYCFVYWLGPLLGMTSCILLFEKIVPFLSGKSTVGLEFPVAQKKIQ